MKTPEEWADTVVSVEREPHRSAILTADGQEAPFEVTGPEVGLAVRDAIARVVRSAVAEALGSGVPGMELSDAEAADIRARADAATPGPWHVGHAAEGLHQMTCNGRCRNVWAGDGVDVTSPCGGLSGADADFVAHSREDVRRLLDDRDHRSALFRDMADTGEAGAYRRGYEAGAKGKAEALRKLLSDAQWRGWQMTDDGPITGQCVASCGGYEGHGHFPGCPVAEALGLPTEEP